MAIMMNADHDMIRSYCGIDVRDIQHTLEGMARERVDISFNPMNYQVQIFFTESSTGVSASCDAFTRHSLGDTCRDLIRQRDEFIIEDRKKHRGGQSAPPPERKSMAMAALDNYRMEKQIANHIQDAAIYGQSIMMPMPGSKPKKNTWNQPKTFQQELQAEVDAWLKE